MNAADMRLIEVNLIARRGTCVIRQQTRAMQRDGQASIVTNEQGGGLPALVPEEALQGPQKTSSCLGLLLEALGVVRLAGLHVTQ